MSEAFLKVVNMSISAGWLVLAVLALRLILKKAPKWVNVLLWGIVAVRLICPFSIESALSLIPSAQTFPQELISGPDFNLQSGIAPVDQQVNDYLNDHYFEGVTVPTNHGANVMGVLTVIWLVGMAILIIYTVISYRRLQRDLSMAVILRDNIFQCETVSSPFVLGLLRPRIYLPYAMDGKDLHHVIAHEQAHIRRKDHWWKPLGFLLLTVHWFNPLMWVAYILLCRDIELACDEKVIAELGNDQRADYTQALVACSINRRMIAACPLAFGEVGVKERVKSIMNYRKPTFWIIVTALVLCVVVAVCFLTDPNPSREFAMKNSNVTGLEPEAIVERILDIEDWESSNVYMNSDNFSLYVDSDFNWVDSQAVRYFFSDTKQTYSAQLRIFPEEGNFFLTEPTEWPEQNRIFLLRHYLDAVRYLPKEEIRRMAPADRYIISHIDGGFPSDYDRVITYTPDGVGDIESWLIHLRLEPLHADGEGYRGSGDEVIDLFYGDGDLRDAVPVFSGDVHLGLNAEIIEIDYDCEIIAVKDIDQRAGVFGDRCLIDCSWASDLDNLMYVNYSQPNDVRIIAFNDFEVGDSVIISLYENQMQTAYNGTAVADRVQLATQRLEHGMEPTQTNLRGLVAEYLFVPINGATYRYAMTEANPENLTADKLLDTFTEETHIEGIAWEVYSLKEYPDMTKLLLRSGVGGTWLCEYAPAQQAEAGALEAARAAGYVIEEDGKLTDGQEAWAEFYGKTQRGEPASIHVAHYYTLDPERTASGTYEAYRQDYPALFIDELAYDGDQFVLRTESEVKVYEYLMQYTVSGTPAVTSSEHQNISHYVLTHSKTVTWEQLWNGLISSASGAYIDHYTICSEYS